MNVVELYAGTARSAEPFRNWKKCRISLLVDACKYAAKTYLANHPDAPYVTRDLSRATPRWVKRKAGGRVDVLLGCPPCQGFSDNGQRKPRDRRNRHLENFARIAIGLRPRAIAMENVPLAVSAPAFRRFTRTIENAGYKWTAGIVNAAAYGSCQCRQRLLYVAIRDDLGSQPVIPPPSHGGRRRYFNYNTRRMCTLRESRAALLGVAPGTYRVRDLLPYREGELGREPIPRLGECLAGLPRIGSDRGKEIAHFHWSHTRAQLQRMGRLTEGGQARRSQDYYSHSYGRLHMRGLAKTITGAFPNAGSGRTWHPTDNRALSLREAARVQGFPDSFSFREPYSLAAAAVGNALDAALASVTYGIIRRCIIESSTRRRPRKPLDS